jgi:hypothetical protein
VPHENFGNSAHRCDGHGDRLTLSWSAAGFGQAQFGMCSIASGSHQMSDQSSRVRWEGVPSAYTDNELPCRPCIGEPQSAVTRESSLPSKVILDSCLLLTTEFT